ncbi:hypothetical protein DRN94_004010 [archaeon]|nr:hypothetical protein [archaeon]
MPPHIDPYTLALITHRALRAGKAVARRILYEAGFEFAQRRIRSVEPVSELDQAAERVREWFSELGLGGLETQFLEAGGGRLSVKLSPIASRYSELFGRSEHPVCFFTAGILAGAFSHVTGIHFSCEEAFCLAQGSVECVFALTLFEEILPEKTRALTVVDVTLLPEELRYTAGAMLMLGEADPESIAVITGRSPDEEKKCLEQLFEEGYLKKVRIGERILYRLALGGD